jgi:peptidoglycan/xylan/chitin deacetylase (PgdA/CDA1 family)
MRKCTIVTYHSLDDSGSVISTSPQSFREQMEGLANSGMPVVPLHEVTNSIGAVALTFDDGFLNFLTHGMPVLEQFGMPATVFPVTAFCGMPNKWDAQGRSIPSLKLMAWSDLRQLPAALISVGAHSARHLDLTALVDSRIESELDECRRAIEDGLGVTPTEFAYPYGACNAIVRNAVGRRFSLACGTRMDFAGPETDRLDLPRIDAFYVRNPRRLVQIVTGNAGFYVAACRTLRALRASL